MNKKARQFAPRKTGETMRGIRRKKIKTNTYSVQSYVRPKGSSGFMQNFWANRTPPHHRPSMSWNRNRPTVYGDGSHRTTGIPMFFSVATKLTQSRFKKLSVNETRKILNNR